MLFHEAVLLAIASDDEDYEEVAREGKLLFEDVDWDRVYGE